MSQYYIKVKSCESAPNAEPEYWSRQIVSPTQSNLFWNDGHVGIGAPNPLAMLQVDGNVGIGTAYSTKTPPVDGLIVSGNMGVGTFEPEHKLHVIGNARIEGNLIVNGSQTIIDTDVQTTERLDITNNGTGPALRVNQVGGNDVIDILDNGVSVLKILDGGNVGIGAATPQEKLHVVGSIKVSDRIVNASGRTMLNQTGGVLQVKNVFEGGIALTGVGNILTLSITPSSTSSKILVMASFTADKNGGSTDTHLYVNLRRNGNSIIEIGNAVGYLENVGTRVCFSNTYMDSPASTSAVSYEIYDKREGNAGGTSYTYRNITITLMEIAG